MVLSQAAEERQQRILLKRALAKREAEEQQRLAESEKQQRPAESEGNSSISKEPQEHASDATSSDEEVQQQKQPKLDLPDTKTIVSNVFRYLGQEYKHLQLLNEDNPSLRPLAAINQRTANATGLCRNTVRNIVMEDRKRIADVRQREREAQRTNEDSSYAQNPTEGASNSDES